MGPAAVLDEIPEDTLIVVADDEDLADLRKLCDCGEAVGDDWVTWKKSVSFSPRANGRVSVCIPATSNNGCSH